ncbi:MAG: hypothetical protein GDA55_05115 [Cellvibrionales bacterium]|nr:hypothetical protein [Cellvibrionales bacterium]
MHDLALYLLLVTAVACGWLLARWQQRGKSKPAPHSSYQLPAYFEADLPDYALDAFLAAVDVTGDTLETHLALGALHRRRGELERAIRLHENLLRRPGLTATQASQAKFELALDYRKAGLMDRAEGFLQELIEKSDSHRKPALHLLIDLYQDQREWLKAANAAHELQPALRKPERLRLARRRSHFFCEQAELALVAQDYLSARRHIKRAAQISPAARRPALLMASLELQLGHAALAKSMLEEQLAESDQPASDSLELLHRTYTALGQPAAHAALLESLYRRTGSLLVLTHLVRTDQVQTEHLADFLATAPLKLVGLPVTAIAGLDKKLRLTLARSWLNALRQPGGPIAHHQCTHCGFKSHEHRWQCPACRRWETLHETNPHHASPPSHAS